MLRNLQRNKGKIPINKHEFHKEEKYRVSQSCLAENVLSRCQFRRNIRINALIVFRLRQKTSLVFFAACGITDPILFFVHGEQWTASYVSPSAKTGAALQNRGAGNRTKLSYAQS